MNEKLSHRHRHLINEFCDMENVSAKEANALGFMSRILVQATLPHLDPKLPPGSLYSRDTGLIKINIVPTTTKYGIPFGTIPRIVLAWICTEALRTNNRHLVLGRSQNEFLGKINLANNGRDISRMKTQCLRLFRAVVSVESSNDKAEASARMAITNSDFVFWPNGLGDSRALWESSLELSQDFLNEIKAHPVPIDLRVYHALSKAPLAMDIYAWLTYRSYVLQRARIPVAKIPWEGLMAQFGVNYAKTPAGKRAFRHKFQLRLKEVLVFLPDLSGCVKAEQTHLLLQAPRREIVMKHS